MKVKFVFIAALFFIAFACHNRVSKTTEETLSVVNVLEKAEKLIDQEILITGTVNHVCAHSGRRCFLIDSTGENSIRVEASGEIESFSKEIMGSEIKVKGILKESRLSAQEINEWELEVKNKQTDDAENNGETCNAEMANINDMRKWMKEHGKDYYAIYYIDGLSYEVVE